jgi:hypothetical protein
MRARPIATIALSLAAVFSRVDLRAQTAVAAKAFLLGVYGHYQHGAKGIDFESPNAALYYHSSLVALIRQDIKANGPGNAPAIDFDPICACQDWRGIWSLKIDVHLETPKRARANVSFSLASPKNPSKDANRQLAITLVPVHGAWRIYDIEDDSDSSTTFALRKLLQDDIDTIHKDAGADANR